MPLRLSTPSNPLSVWASCGLMRSIRISLSSPIWRATITGKGQHVPEWEAEIVDQHVAPRIRMPLGEIKRRQEIVELAGGGVEIDLNAQPSTGRAWQRAAPRNPWHRPPDA